MKTKTRSPKRISTKIPEFDRVLGGGLVPGQSVLISGPRGCGKSTLLLQVVANVPHAIFTSGEMSTTEFAIYTKRLGISAVCIGFDNGGSDIYKMCENAKKLKTPLLVIDTIQTTFLSDEDSHAGSTQQINAVAYHLTEWAAKNQICVILSSHRRAREMTAAVPESVQHLVSTVIDLDCYDYESDPLAAARDKHNQVSPDAANLRLLSCSEKNRYGKTPVEELLIAKDDGLHAYVRKRSHLAL